MKTTEALRLARDLKFGPLPKPDNPLPSLDEAIKLIREARRRCGFNWLTGEAAEQALQKEKRRPTHKGEDHETE